MDTYTTTLSALGDGSGSSTQDVGTASAFSGFALPSPETITFAGSGLVFVNTYTANVTAEYRGAIIAAENFLQAHIKNSVTINQAFDTKNGGANGFVASNTFFLQNTSYSSLKSALS